MYSTPVKRTVQNGAGSNGVQKGFRWVSTRVQKRSLSDPQNILSRRLRDSVFSLLLLPPLVCPYVHILPGSNGHFGGFLDERRYGESSTAFIGRTALTSGTLPQIDSTVAQAGQIVPSHSRTTDLQVQREGCLMTHSMTLDGDGQARAKCRQRSQRQKTESRYGEDF
jgi:hypothetical protein